jgi:hypothetical protein
VDGDHVATDAASQVIGRPSAPTPPPGALDLRAPGTVAMSELLEDKRASVSVMADSYRSAERVAALRAQGPPPDRNGQLQFELLVASELAKAGRLAEAAASYEALRTELTQLGQSEAFLTPLNKMLATTYLRLGELANCAANHNADSCLLPIQGGGVHRDPTGSRAATRELQRLLTFDPNDLSSRWLLNIAAMTLDEYPQGVPERWRIDPAVFASQHDPGRFFDVAPALGLAAPDLSGGVVLDDLDGDGDLDVMASSWGPRDQLRFFRNEGDGRFTDRTAEAGLTGLTGGLNLVPADYDNDGLLDVLLLRGAWRFEQGAVPNSLLRNLGQGRFEDVTQAAGLFSEHPTQTAAWADFDGDGDLDVYIGNETQPRLSAGQSGPYGIGGEGRGHPNELFLNEGDGTFREIGAQVGLDQRGFTKAVVWGDIDEDGDPDLFLSRMLQPNQLFRNDGPDEAGTWVFTDITTEAGVAEPKPSFPAWFFDYDQDGRLDLYVSSYGNPERFLQDSAGDVMADYLGLPTNAARAHLYRNLGDGRFENVAPAAGVDDVLMGMGANWGDLDNDGWPDYYVGTGDPDYGALMPNRAYRNAGDGSFQDVTTAAGLGHLQKGHGVAFGDIDNDGDQDIYQVLGGAVEGDWYPNALFLNPGHGKRWLTLELQGVSANRSAIGARITVEVDTPAGPRSIHHLVGSGGSFGASSLRAEIGLNDATALRGIEIRWPGSGAVDRLTTEDLALDGAYRVSEGGAVEAMALAPIPMPEPGATHGGHGGAGLDAGAP